jgi:hypothetical protein
MAEVELSLLHRVLDALEEQENALLVWGDTGGFLILRSCWRLLLG